MDWPQKLMKSCSWSAGGSRRQMTLLHTPNRGVSIHEPEVVETWATFWPGFSPASMFTFTNPIRSTRKKPTPCGVSALSSSPLSLPQIKISVIKLIKVMHANMPHGSRPDFIRHTVVESCGSSTFDVAFFIIENNWILPPLSLSLLLSLTHTCILPCSLWACSLNQPLVRRCWCRVSVPSGGFRQLFRRVLPRLRLKNRFEQPRHHAWERHFNAGQGSFCRLEWRLPVSGSGETCGSGGEAYRGSVALPPYQLGRA